MNRPSSLLLPSLFSGEERVVVTTALIDAIAGDGFAEAIRLLQAAEGLRYGLLLNSGGVRSDPRSRPEVLEPFCT